ncbi:M60 family metallopeptidase [Bacteroides finegoldii]|uniref:M60 family metallopeptidase n=1 Tax=Bacteroides finegoldii TaxID=338188 RepID=UPI00189F9F62|nr:M60 family metallopeptidase [Bacteroides finegoldii]
MKHIYNYLTFLFCLFTMTVYTGCKDDEEELIAKQFEIDGSELNKEIDFRSTTISIPVKTNMRVSEWTVNSNQKWVTAFQQKDEITLSILDSKLTNERTAKITVTSEIADVNYTITLTQYGINDVQFKDDKKIVPTDGWANQQHGSDGIEKSYDTSLETGYHSPWESGFDNPTTIFPVILDYYFANNSYKIDKIVYYQPYGNGAIGKFKLGYSLKEKQEYENDDFTFLKDENNNDEIFDFKQSGGTQILDTDKLPQGTKAIRFHVLDGYGNNKNPDNEASGKVEGFVACKDMSFYEKTNYREMNDPILQVFTDLTCSELKPDVTDEAIEALTSNTLKRVAKALKDNTYDEWEKNFRIREYEAYSDNNYWATQIQTKKYSDLDNPTGIYVKKDEELMVLVGKIPDGQQVSLQCIWEEGGTKQDFDHQDPNAQNYVQTAASGDKYSLVEGVNMLKMKGQGQLFVMYNVKGEGLKQNPAPVKIHIPLGRGIVNGFFDLKEHKTDAKYAELLSKATHKYFCVRGERMMFYFHRLKMLDAAPTEILSAIHLWDNILKWEQEMSGVEKYRQEGSYNNHMFSISPEGSYMWASDYRVAFVYTYLRNILLYDNVMAAEDNAWGPAHEMGHVHQYAINWPSSTESSNNLFSNYVIYRLGKYKSRGRGLDYMAKSVYGDGRAWYNMGSSTHQNEDTEVHMRMNWQLWIYYELCKGTADNPTIWPRIFEIMRTTYGNIPENDPGKRQMAFVKAVCEATGEDLTEFFETWGFFKPVNESIEQYGSFQYTVTKTMIEETKQNIKSKQYPKAAPIQYIEDRKQEFFTESDSRYKEVGDVGYYTTFKDNVKITKTPTYTEKASTQGKAIVVSNGDQAVAFEVRKQTGSEENLIMGETVYFSNSFDFFVPRTVSMAGCGLYAVQADGTRILMKRTN